MNDRERLLAIVVGASVSLILVWMAWSYYEGSVASRRGQIDAVESKLMKQKLMVKETINATKKLNEYETRSLPRETAIARSLYQHWLLTKVQEAGLRDQVVTPSGQRPQGDVYIQQTFTLNGKGRYEQIVQLLHEIYNVDLLHRVSRISIKPIKDSKDLDLQLTLDALSLRTAPDAMELKERPSKRLKLATLEDYQKSIVGRNVFAPANLPPQVAGLGKQRASTNRSFEVTAKATDPNPLDKVKFELVKSAASDARLDENGRFRWIPKKPGDYEFEIAVSDDSYPPRVTTEKLLVTVTDPPPERVVEAPPPKLGFDNAKHTVLTAVIAVGKEGEVWLHVRPTAQVLKLHEGETFDIGSMKGVVRDIDTEGFVFESNASANSGKRYRLLRGETLEQASLQPVPTSTEAAPASDLIPAGADPASSEEPTTEEPATEEPVKTEPVPTPADADRDPLFEATRD
jgi:hypothetical protein